MKIEIGKIKEQFVTLPKFMVSIHKTTFSYTRFFFAIGRLYKGYIGLMIKIGTWEMNLWIHNFNLKLGQWAVVQ